MFETYYGPKGRIRPVVAVLAIMAATQLTACGLGGPAFAPPEDSTVHVVEMTSTLSFYPSEVHIMAGETVEWRNRSLFTHTVTDDPSKASDPADSSLPAGAKPFSAQVGPGDVYRHTFTVPGTYDYFCEPHEGLDMVGRVVVQPTT